MPVSFPLVQWFLVLHHNIIDPLLERGRKVQSIVPDLRISISVAGNLTPSLHEIKVISSSKTRYNPHRQGQEAARAVDVRAGQLQQEYMKKARTTDQ